MKANEYHNTDAVNNLFERALYCLLLKEPAEKVKAAVELQELLQKDQLSLEPLGQIKRLEIPGRPSKPELVDPKAVPRRNFSSLKGRLTLVHAITHIEFNAINLALDAVYRFQQMPAQFYMDWCQVAVEEALHFSMLSAYLQQHGMAYGDLPAHNGLWEMAVKTDFDVMVRMALVPRVLEARGLDVTPGMIKKLQATGDVELISVLQKIFEDEIGHVKIGTFWYKSLCEDRKLDPDNTFIELIEHYMQGARFGPFDTEARLQAGFSHEEMERLLQHI